jgi:hypothetical protein
LVSIQVAGEGDEEMQKTSAKQFWSKAMRACVVVFVTSAAEACDAKATWEAMVAAKGGRQRLERINRFLIIEQYRWKRLLGSSTLDFRTLYILPDFVWQWKDYGSKMFGTEASLTDYRRNEEVISRWGAEVTARKQINSRQDDAYLTLFLFETRWHKPRLTACTDGTAVDTDWTIKLDVAVPDASTSIRFFLPRGCFLPNRAEIRQADQSVLVYRFDDYTPFQGIVLPRLRQLMETHKSIPYRLRYEIDPECDAHFLERTPAISAGPDAWRPKGRK